MARRVEEFPENPSGRYPWEEWLDGSVWELILGEDILGKPSSFRSAAITQAKRKGGKVRTVVKRAGVPHEKDRMYVQYVNEAEAPSSLLDAGE